MVECKGEDMTKPECPPGKCIRGKIGDELVTEDEWEQKATMFLEKIEEFNTLGLRQQLPHPGFSRLAKFCCECGKKLSERENGLYGT